MIQLQASGLPTWAQVTERRLAHIQRVTSLLRAWSAAMRVPPGEANAWIDAGTWHDALRDAPVAELRQITGDRTSPDGLLHGPAVAVPDERAERDLPGRPVPRVVGVLRARAREVGHLDPRP